MTSVPTRSSPLSERLLGVPELGSSPVQSAPQRSAARGGRQRSSSLQQRRAMLVRLGVTPRSSAGGVHRRVKSARLTTVTSHTSLLSAGSLSTPMGFFGVPSFADAHLDVSGLGLPIEDELAPRASSLSDDGLKRMGLTPQIRGGPRRGAPRPTGVMDDLEKESGGNPNDVSLGELSLTADHEVDVDEVRPGVGILKSVFTLCNTTVGAGTLALPFFFSQTGIVLGGSLLGGIALFSSYSLHLLTECGRCELTLKQTEDGKPARSYLDVAYFAFKRTGRLVVTVAMLLLTFGALIAYFVIIGSLLESAVVTFVERGKGLTIVLPTPAPGAKAVPHAEAIAVAKAVGVPPWLLQSPFLSGLALICPILPLGSLKNMSALGFVSLVALSSVACLIALVVQDGARAAAAGTTPTPALAAWGPRVFFTIPTVALAYTNQPNIYEIADELHNPTVRRVAAVINISTIATTFLYFLVGVFGYVHFGTGTATNILLNYPPAELSLVDAVLFTGGKLAMAIAMIGSYPLLLFPSRICLHSLIVQLPRLTMSIVHKWCKRSAYERCDPTAATSCCARCSLPPNVFFYSVTWITAVLVPNIVTVFGLTGALTGTLIVFIMPALFALRLLPGRVCCSWKKIPVWVLLFLGLILMVVSTTFIIIGMIQDATTKLDGGGGGGSGGGTTPNVTLLSART